MVQWPPRYGTDGSRTVLSGSPIDRWRARRSGRWTVKHKMCPIPWMVSPFSPFFTNLCSSRLSSSAIVCVGFKQYTIGISHFFVSAFPLLSVYPPIALLKSFNHIRCPHKCIPNTSFTSLLRHPRVHFFHLTRGFYSLPLSPPGMLFLHGQIDTGFVQILPPHLTHCHLIDTLHSIPCLLPFLVRSFFSLIPSLLCVIVASLLLLSLFSISRPLWWWCRTTLTRLSDSHPFPPILFTFPPFTLIAACRSFFSSSRFSFLFSFSRSILSTADCHRIPLVKSVHLPLGDQYAPFTST